MKDHYIVCGLGRVGRGVVRELQHNKAPLVAIDKDAERARWASDMGIPTLIADSTEDGTLIEAGVKGAKGLVAALSSDADNVYVALSARGLNDNLLVAARATSEAAEEKLRRAGATTVFTPYTYIGHRLAQSMLRPHVLSFLDIATVFRKSDLDLEFEQIRVSESSRVAGKSLKDSHLREEYGVIVLAVIKPDGDTQFNPQAKTRIEVRDVLIAMGERSKLATHGSRAGGPAALKKILTAAQMREIDRRTIEERGIPGLVLMENAGARVYELLASRFSPLNDRRVVILLRQGQ